MRAQARGLNDMTAADTLNRLRRLAAAPPAVLPGERPPADPTRGAASERPLDLRAAAIARFVDDEPGALHADGAPRVASRIASFRARDTSTWDDGLVWRLPGDHPAVFSAAHIEAERRAILAVMDRRREAAAA